MVRAEKYGRQREKTILFGDDSYGWVLDEMPEYKNEKGMTLKKYYIRPSELLIKMYPELMQPGQLDENGAKWVEYPAYHVCDTNTSRTNAIARVHLAYNGVKTPLSEKLNSYANDLEMMESKNENLNITNMELIEEVSNLQGALAKVLGNQKKLDEIWKAGPSKSDVGDDNDELIN